ncbi:MAG: response regulator transcription factor [Reichenbachiella sp.]
MTKILIADDHPLMADSIKSLLESGKDIQVVTVTHDGVEAIEILSEIEVDIALLDIDMPKMNGLDCAKKIKSEYPDVKVAILSMHQEKAMISGLMELGIKGYMLKTIPKEELLLAIETIQKGGEYFNSEITKVLLDNSTEGNATNVEHLSARELEIVKLIAEGFTNPQIGEKLFISPKTVDVHRTNVMKKIGVNNVAGVVRFAFQNKLIN